MKTSFCTIAYRNLPEVPLHKILTEVKAAGYDGVELWWPQVECGAESEWHALRDLARSLDLAIPILSPYLGTFDLPMTNRQEMLARMQAAARAAAALGAPLVRSFAGWTCECSSLTATPEYWAYNCAGFREMDRVAEDFGVELAIETHANSLADSVAGIRRLAECGRRIKVNLQLDTLAENSGLPDGAAVYAALQDLVVHVHLPLETPEEKIADHRRLLSALKAAQFAGFCSLEHCSGKGEPQAVLAAGREWLRKLDQPH